MFIKKYKTSKKSGLRSFKVNSSPEKYWFGGYFEFFSGLELTLNDPKPLFLDVLYFFLIVEYFI